MYYTIAVTFTTERLYALISLLEKIRHQAAEK